MIFEEFTNQHKSLLLQSEEKDGVWHLTAGPKTLRTLLETMQPIFNYPEDLTCVDEGDQVRVLYRLASLGTGLVAHVHVRVPHTGGHLPSACDLWRGYEWQEREVFDLFGVVFDGHPDLRRILTWDGFDGHPLLKDYQVDPDDMTWEIPEQCDEEIIDLLQQ